MWHSELCNKDNLYCFCSFNSLLKSFRWVFPTLFAEILIIRTEDYTCPSRLFSKTSNDDSLATHSSTAQHCPLLCATVRIPSPLPWKLQTNSVFPQRHPINSTSPHRHVHRKQQMREKRVFERVSAIECIHLMSQKYLIWQHNSVLSPLPPAITGGFFSHCIWLKWAPLSCL